MPQVYCPESFRRNIYFTYEVGLKPEM